jgi:hypothetical protein
MYGRTYGSNTSKGIKGWTFSSDRDDSAVSPCGTNFSSMSKQHLGYRTT